MTKHWPLMMVIVISVGCSSTELCDRVSKTQEREGNLGQSADFSWLGVLHVPLEPDWVATTGIVLIKIKHALANADDVARIPQHIFQSESRAMFVVARDTPWFVKPASYVTHPEYEYSTINSIAIIELNLDDVDDFPLTPICLATVRIFSASRYLYLTGFTHENQNLEKVFYKIQYLDKKKCKEYYNRTELSPQELIPSAYLCGYAPNNATQCVWDNGMTLVSNDFGYLNLIGFSVHGPSCAAPARFIDLFPYFHWINSITDEGETRKAGDSNFRRNEFIPKIKRKKVVPNIPIHELYTMGGSRRKGSIVHKFEAYPFKAEAMKFHLIKPTKDGNAYLIFPFKEQWQKVENSCTVPTVVIYEEVFRVTAVNNLRGSATYKLSLYDTINTECICVRLTVECDKRSDAILSFKEETKFKEDTHQETLGGLTPDEVLIHFPVPKRGVETELLSPYFINDNDIFSKKVLNYDLYITFEFTGRAKMTFEMLAKKPDLNTSRTTESTPVTITAKAETLKRRAEIKEQKKQKSYRKNVNRADNTLREGKASVVPYVKEARVTQSAARGEGAPGVALMGGWMLAAALRKALYTH